ncbi:rab-GTPase-TBC domain-containing protein [Crassisporium funariophilum]|nr:rab-GTPase-TBC domain-containing protein [Crassisporium funariophilum]
MASIHTTTAHQHIPAPLHLPEFDDDDAFDVADDNPAVPYVFSPDAIREDMARNMPDFEETWGEGDSTASTGGFFSDHNTSVSTLDIGPHGSPSYPPSLETPLDSSLSSHFSHISLNTPYDETPPHGSANQHSSSEDRNTMNGNGHSTYPRATVDFAKSPSMKLTVTSPPDSPSDIQSPLPTASPLPTPTTERIHSNDVVSTPSRSQFSADSASDPTLNPSNPQTSTSLSLPAISSTSQSKGLTEKPRSHRPHRSVGPSAFEKVRSKTRPTFLPPKPRQEDDKHMADWQQMMKLSRVAAEKRRKALQERRLAREKEIDDSLHIWEKEILPDWKVVHRNAELRKLWWRGIPTKLRAPLWEKAVGNELALSKDHYRTCLSRAKRALASGVFPQSTLDLIEEDMSTTLCAIHIFHKETGPLYPDLKDMLCAWVVSRSDEGLGYTPGAARIAAMLLINMPSQQGFIVMRNLLERHCLRSFFGGERAKEDVEAYYRIFDTMLADGMPKIYFNFKQHQISPAAYLPDWLIPLFMDHLPFEACARIWDVLLLEGDSFLYRASLGILAVLEPRLFFPDKKELLDLLKGENKAALDVAKREGRPLNGGKYEIYGVDEETLWDRIDNMHDWWKDNTWTRLIQRELPDL